MQKQNKISYIQMLRATAVMLVVGHHYPGGIAAFKYGYIGVDLFFVICGYIMVYTTSKSDGSFAYFKNFIIRRLSRVWPVYVILTLLFFVIFYMVETTNTMMAIKWILKSITFFPMWNSEPIIKQGWTLPFEVWFYLMFGISMLFGKKRWIALFLMTAFTLIAVRYNSILYSYGSYDGIGSYVYMISTGINWCFTIGVIIGLISNSHIKINKFICQALIFASTTIIFIWLSAEKGPEHGVITGLVFGFMTLGLDGVNKISPISIPKSIIIIGDMSFSIYLCHEFIRYGIVKYFPNYFHVGGAVPYMFVPYVLLSIGLAFISYRVLELKVSFIFKDFMMRLMPDKEKSTRPASLTNGESRSAENNSRG
ncbi:acyltransferase [Yersinia enterocolitica]